MPEPDLDPGFSAPADGAQPENPRAVIGANNPPLGQMIAAESGDFATVVTAFLEAEYQQYPEQMQALLDGAANLPETITSQEDKEATATVVKQLRDLNAKFKAFHNKEKQPYLRGGQAVDQYFFGMMDKLAARNRNDRPGAMDVLLKRMTAYDNMLIEQERQRRLAAEAEARRVAEAARREAEEAARIQREADARAARARTEATRLQREQEAQQRREHAAATAALATTLADTAQAARVETVAPVHAVVRNRGNDGTLSTVRVVPYAIVEDRTLLDKDRLWPFLKMAAIEQALAAWAKTTDYNIQMPGASIGRRNESTVR